MKKIILLISALYSLSTLNAIEVTNVTNKVALNYGMVEHSDNKDDDILGILSLSVGKDYYFDNNLFFSGNINLGYNENNLDLSSDLKLGYTFLKDNKTGINLYGTISPLIQQRLLNNTYTDNSESAMGMGVGAGVEYNFENKYCISANYINYYMNGTTSSSYQYSKAFLTVGHAF